MGFLRKVAGFLGFAKDDHHDAKAEAEDETDDQAPSRVNFHDTGLPRKGFSVPVQVAVERSQIGPLLAPCASGDGGVQGLRWYAKRLRIDEDGDVADEFLDEVLPETLVMTEDHREQLGRFKLRHSTKPAKIKSQVLSQDGKFQLCVEHRGRLQWV
ncbi:Phospholipid hydroperoxide glutathione peroxidase [Quillaja saponaria]|uniref:Phospholipid hydroperoxide glutathione peroxidase n=1 Tax=Quillaja saponaria TaxID=32244 RepID=A0AAD7P747_QUISA|nr:Phospholipid hydroperoxide glutathione peroxidase [Quillaja saponaria]